MPEAEQSAHTESAAEESIEIVCGSMALEKKNGSLTIYVLKIDGN
jgi:hypothetical protein